MNTATFHTTPRILDPAKGIVEYVASDTALDADHEVVIPSGVQFNRFAKNAPFLDSHRKGDSIDRILGKVLSSRVEGDQLLQQVQWAIDVEENDLARLGFKMTERGYLRAVSISFLPLQYLDARSPHELAKAIDAYQLNPAVQRVFTQVEQIELSAVTIGSNPNAVLKAFSDSALTAPDLRTLGITTDERFDFLTEAARVQAHPDFDRVAKSFIGAVFSSFSQTAPTSANPARSQPSPPPASPRQPHGDNPAPQEVKALCEKLGALFE